MPSANSRTTSTKRTRLPRRPRDPPLAPATSYGGPPRRAAPIGHTINRATHLTRARKRITSRAAPSRRFLAALPRQSKQREHRLSARLWPVGTAKRRQAPFDAVARSGDHADARRGWPASSAGPIGLHGNRPHPMRRGRPRTDDPDDARGAADCRTCVFAPSHAPGILRPSGSPEGGRRLWAAHALPDGPRNVEAILA